MKRLYKLFKLQKNKLLIFIIIVMLTLIHQFSYSYVPIFTQTLIKVIKNFQSSSVLDWNLNVSLPKFVLNFIFSDMRIMQVIIMISISLMTLQIFRFALRFLEMHLKGIYYHKTAEDLRIKLFDHIQNLSFSFHNKSDSGDLIQRVTTDIDKTTSFITQDTFEVVYLIATIGFGAFQLLQINTTIVLATIALLPIVAISSIIYFNKVDQLFIDIEETESEMMKVIQENLSQAKTVRSFANEDYEIEKLETRNTQNKSKEIRANKLIAKYWGTMDFIATVQYIFVIAVSVIYFKDSMDSADLIASLALVGMLIWPVRGLGRIINNLGKALVAADRLHEILDLESEYVNNGTLDFKFEGKIEFKNVYFKYPDDERYVLEDVSFIVEPHQKVAIIGKTGSGKTSILNLILKMYMPDAGQILIDDVPIEEIDTRILRRQVGMVMQDPFLYSKTIYENIAIANPKSEESRVIDAATKASFDREVNAFENRYQTVVGEKGTTLSGGQKQRVAIARILLKNAPVLVFDDALSALDNKTDMAIQSTLAKEDKTMIIVTHRMSTASQADKIIVIENQKVSMIGTHLELLKKEGLYQTLWQIQGNLEQMFIDSIEGENHE